MALRLSCISSVEHLQAGQTTLNILEYDICSCNAVTVALSSSWMVYVTHNSANSPQNGQGLSSSITRPPWIYGNYLIHCRKSAAHDSPSFSECNYRIFPEKTRLKFLFHARSYRIRKHPSVYKACNRFCQCQELPSFISFGSSAPVKSQKILSAISFG